MDMNPLIGLQLRGASERRLAPVEVEQCRGQHVGAKPRVAPDRPGHPGWLGAEQHADGIDRVAPDVEESASTGTCDVADVVGIDVVIGEEDLHREQITDGPFGEQPAHLDPQRVQPVHERLHQEHPGVLGRLHHPPRLGAAHGERLLAEDVLACLRRLDRPLGVEVVGERDVHGIDGRVVEQVLVGAVPARDREPGSSLLGPGGRARRNRVHLAQLRPLHPGYDVLHRDPGDAEDAPPHRVDFDRFVHGADCSPPDALRASMTAGQSPVPWLAAGIAAGACAALGLGLVVLGAVRGNTPTAAGPPHLVEQAESIGVQHVYDGEFTFFVGGGVAVLDCDDDGWPDLYIAGGANEASLYRNESVVGDMAFTRVDGGATALTDVSGAYPIDIDSDGFTDLAVLRLGENVVLRGLGDCNFERANETWSIDGGDEWTVAFSAAWEDDATWPTMVFGNYVELGPTRGTDRSLLGPHASATSRRCLRRPCVALAGVVHALGALQRLGPIRTARPADDQ